MRRSSLWMLPLTDGCVGVWAPRGYQRDRMRHAGKPPAAPVNRGSKAVPHGQRGASRAGGAQSPCSSDALARSRHGRRRCRYGGRRAAGRPPGRSQVSCKASLRCSSQQVNCCFVECRINTNTRSTATPEDDRGEKAEPRRYPPWFEDSTQLKLARRVLLLL